MLTKGNAAFSAIVHVSLLTEVTYCHYIDPAVLWHIYKPCMLASQKLYVLAKLDSVPLPAVQTCPQCVGVVYGSRDACTTSMSMPLNVKAGYKRAWAQTLHWILNKHGRYGEVALKYK